ncbi:MAG TPA: hypothetical protein VNL14_02255 [Candidatus Acidoferrales bacterium]|nr:hypothetical protein [Candidatus Acidoferrales bacterium]
MITARALARKLIDHGGAGRVREARGPRRDWERGELPWGSMQNGWGGGERQGRTCLRAMRGGKSGAQRLKTYGSLNRFRTVPGVKVHDFTGQHRRQDCEIGEHQADLAMQLKRAVDLRWKPEAPDAHDQGDRKYGRVHANDFFG